MHTTKLRHLQQPSRLEAMLESLVINRNWIAPGSQRVYDRSDLPSVLQKLAIKAEKGDCTWRAWNNHDGLRLFVVEMSLSLSRERGRPALQVRYYNEQGGLQEYSVWAQLADDSWQRCIT
jgi:hypothetical protein